MYRRNLLSVISCLPSAKCTSVQKNVFFSAPCISLQKNVFTFRTDFLLSKERVYFQNRHFTFKRACLLSKQTFYFQKSVFTFRTQTLLHPQIHKHTFPPTVLLRLSLCPEQCFWIPAINLKY